MAEFNGERGIHLPFFSAVIFRLEVWLRMSGSMVIKFTIPLNCRDHLKYA